MLISIPLFVLIMLTFFSMITNGGNFTTISQGFQGYSFSMTATSGLIGLIVTLIIVGGLVGINFLGSGLNDASVRIIQIGIAYGGIWIIFTVLSVSLLLSIQVFGIFIYVGLTIIYVVGVFQKIAEG